jgi:hypothetical protein
VLFDAILLGLLIILGKLAVLEDAAVKRSQLEGEGQ